MKKLFIVLILFYCSPLFAQTLPDFDAVKLKTESDSQAADTVVLAASNYILSTPFDKESVTQKSALRFMLKWMELTPDYNFQLDEKIGEIIKDNQTLFGVFMAAMCKFCLENKAASKSDIAVKMNSIVLMLNYAENTKNNIKMTSSLKRLIDAKNNGTLSNEL